MDSSEAHIRKRVCKACDRCRLKKSKCDGASPCSRCRADNAICVFGERKKTHDKVYPKGYVEMLEQQQTQLVSGLRDLYRRLQAGESWPGSPLPESQGGHPLTHDILERLDLLYMNGDSGSPTDAFEDDFSKMQQRLLDNGATYMHRRGSVSSDSDHGHPASPVSMLGTPSSQSLSYSESSHNTPPMTYAQPMTAPNMKPSPALSLPGGAAAFYKPESMGPEQLMRSAFALQAPQMDDSGMLDYMSQFDASMSYDAPMTFDHYAMASAHTPPVAAPEWMEQNDMVDFNAFVDHIHA